EVSRRAVVFDHRDQLRGDGVADRRVELRGAALLVPHDAYGVRPRLRGLGELRHAVLPRRPDDHLVDAAQHHPLATAVMEVTALDTEGGAAPGRPPAASTGPDHVAAPSRRGSCPAAGRVAPGGGAPGVRASPRPG